MKSDSPLLVTLSVTIVVPGWSLHGAGGGTNDRRALFCDKMQQQAALGLHVTTGCRVSSAP